jgi:hypothetical protein
VTCWGSVREDNLLERPQQKYCKLVCIHVDYHIYMHKNETPVDVHRWFVGVIRDLWPVAVGSLSLRRGPCIRPNCPACASGQGHSSYALYGAARRSAVLDLCSAEAGAAGAHGHSEWPEIAELINEAGVRYMNALKRQDSKLNT